METKVEALEGNQKKLTVTIDAEDVDARIKKQYKDFAYKYNFPGFRKGKAPRPVIDSALGKEAVRATVTDDVLNSLYPIAMDENDLIPIGQPAFEDAESMVEAGKPYSFAVTVETRPELELSSYDRVSVKLPSSEASDEDIDAQIGELLNYYYTFEDCEDDVEVADGSFVELVLNATDAEGNDVPRITTESRLYELGGGLFPRSFDEALKGMKKGDAKTVEIDMSEPSMLASGLENPGKTTIEVEVKQLKTKVLPTLDDEWAQKTAGFEGGVKELRERVAESVKQQKEDVLPRIRENETLYALQERLEGDVPAGLAEQEEQTLLQNFFMQMQQSGMTFDQYLASAGLTTDNFRDDLKKQAKDVVAQDLALDAWARHAGIEVTDEEVTAEFAKSGADDPAELEADWRKNGRIASLRAGMKRARALEAIIEDLQVEELKPGEKLNSVAAEEAVAAEDASLEEAPEAEAPAQDDAPEAAAEDGKLTKAELNKMKVAELREYAQGKGIEAEGLKKAELVEAVLAAE